ncbi:hypothetical protein K1719_019007 [Acacia pycnantha]|nr:hypothetical protein K1719_019007 [Acacia pycnantha]
MSVVCNEWVEDGYARRKKEEATSRRINAEKSKKDWEKTLDETDLFFIRSNRHMEPNTDTILKGNTRVTTKTDEKERSGDERFLEIKHRRKLKSPSILQEDRDRGDLRRSRKCMTDDEALSPKSDVATVNLEVNGDGSNINQSTDDLRVTDMAMILYNGGVLGEVINGINVLGLNRNAEEGWDSSMSKRQRLVEGKLSPKSDISAYAANLRRTKARIKRNTKRKRKGGKENFPDEVMELEEENLVDADVSTLEADFVFKAGGSKRANFSTEGTGGWPKTATQQP